MIVQRFSVQGSKVILPSTETDKPYRGGKTSDGFRGAEVPKQPGTLNPEPLNLISSMSQGFINCFRTTISLQAGILGNR